MINLNLETKGKEQEIIKHYLEENASESLAHKINSGTQIVKDNKLKRDMNDIDEWFDNMTVDEIVEYGKELDADLLIGTIDYHYNVE